jgi:hypothetical protein
MALLPETLHVIATEFLEPAARAAFSLVCKAVHHFLLFLCHLRSFTKCGFAALPRCVYPFVEFSHIRLWSLSKRLQFSFVLWHLEFEVSAQESARAALVGVLCA